MHTCMMWNEKQCGSLTLENENPGGQYAEKVTILCTYVCTSESRATTVDIIFKGGHCHLRNQAVSRPCHQ